MRTSKLTEPKPKAAPKTQKPGPLVLVDDRERNATDLLARLAAKGARVQVNRLAVGDYVLSKRVCVERKTAADFESSLIDGRLFEQAARLKVDFEKPVIAVVGKPTGRISPGAFRGALLSLYLDFNVQLFFFSSETDLADFLVHAATREQNPKPNPHGALATQTVLANPSPANVKQ